MAKSNKPLVWGLFAGGGMVSAFITPVMIFIMGVGVPLGFLSADIMGYDQIYALAHNLLGKLVLFGVVFLPLWHAAHRLRLTLHDLGIHADMLAAAVLYALAMAGSVATVIFLLRI